MRITQNMMSQQMLTDLQANAQQVMHLQNEVSTGKKINTPADDPVGAGLVMRYQGYLSSYQQYSSNAQNAQQWLNFTDSTMSQATQVMQRARDLAVQASNDTQSASDRHATASEVGQLYQQLVDIGNTQYNGQYIFGGQVTKTAPYPSTGAESVTPDKGSILYDLGDGTHLAVNTSGTDYFGAAASGSASTSDNAFAILQNLQNALNTNDTQGINTAIGQIDQRMTTMSAAQSNVGALSDRAQMVTQRLQTLTQSYTTLLSNVQDADMASVITNLQQAQNVEQASLSVGAKIIQPSLADFLK